MGWKGLFIQEEPAEETATETKVAAPATTVPTTYRSTPTVGTSVANPGAFEGQLRQAVNSSGSEYVRFKNACEELRSVLPDETTRLKSAFVTMKAIGITKDALVSTAKACVGVVTNEQTEFEAAMNAAYSSQVEGGVNKITSIDKQIEEKLSQIGTLQAEVDRMRSEKSKVTTDVEQSRSKIDSARRDFAAAFGKLVDEINLDINRISSSL